MKKILLLLIISSIPLLSVASCPKNPDSCDMTNPGSRVLSPGGSATYNFNCGLRGYAKVTDNDRCAMPVYVYCKFSSGTQTKIVPYFYTFKGDVPSLITTPTQNFKGTIDAWFDHTWGYEDDGSLTLTNKQPFAMTAECHSSYY